MGTFQGPYHDRVRYELQHRGYGNLDLESTDVIGWNDDDKEQHRNDDYAGVFPKFSNSLKFTGKAKGYINSVRKIYGVNAEIRIIKEEKDQDDIWQRLYSGYLSVKTWGEENGKVSLKFDSGGLEKKLESRQKDKVEIERTTDIKGNIIAPLKLKKLHLPGRGIFLITKFKNENINNDIKLDINTNNGGTRNQTGGIPIVIESQSHDLANSVQIQSVSTENKGTTGMMFYALNDRTRLLNIDLSFSLDAFFQQYENVQWCFYQVCLSIYKNGVNYDLKDRIVIDELNSGFNSNNPKALYANNDFALPQFTRKMSGNLKLDQLELLEGESLAFEVYLKSDMYNDNNAGVRCYAQNIDARLQINEDSNFPATLTNGILAYDLLERLVEIITGNKNNFKSKYFGRKELGYEEDGPGAYIFFAHGHWIRLFEKGDDLYKPFATSFKDVLETLNVIENVDLGIERIGFKEYIVIEEKAYFYNNNVTIRLADKVGESYVYNQVKNVKRKTDEDLYFGSIEIGSDKAGDYEEVFGLEETNTKANFTTPIENDNVYSKISKHRWDSYGPEIERRRNKNIKPTDDRGADLHIFLFDVKDLSKDVLELKTWHDVLEVEPINMFNPESAYNFLWSPVQLVIKHGWYINGGLQEYPSDFIRFGSSKGKSKVVIQVKGKKEYAENGNIPISDLAKPRFTPEEISFQYEVSTTINKLIEGTTTILGNKVQNLYGLIEFKNEEGNLEKSRIKSIKPNKKGDFTLTKHTR